jgi:hypothetical protein
MFEIGKAEDSRGRDKGALFWRAIAKAECKEEFWEIWVRKVRRP